MHSTETAGVYTQTAQSHSRYPATSSAFSASAHPHEDWTKISDLAERRRIQNRIAQRNYRKKLKKRLEDLERKAASSSASPEQQPAQLQRQKSPRKKSTQTQIQQPSQSAQQTSTFTQLPSSEQHPAFVPGPDGPLFSEQYTRQLSTSPPPPFSYPMCSQESLAYAPYSTPLPYSSVSPSFPDQTAYSYNPFPPNYPPSTSSVEYPPKTEFYPEMDLQSFSFSYATVPSIEVSSEQPFGDAIPQTPPLSDCHELYCAASPPESSFAPQTPATFEASPRLAVV